MNIKAKIINNNLIVVLEDGEMLFKGNADKSIMTELALCETDEDVRKLLAPELTDIISKEQKEQQKKETIVQNYQLLLDTGEFEVEGSYYKMVGINRTIPALLVERFILALSNGNKDEYTGLKNFWMWCCLNPRAEVADKLFDFLEKNCFRINKQGMFFALRNVVTVDKDNELVKFVSTEYNKIKGIWKKEPKDYWVGKKKEVVKAEEPVSGDSIIDYLEQNFQNWKGSDEDAEELANILSFQYPLASSELLYDYAYDWVNSEKDYEDYISSEPQTEYKLFSNSESNDDYEKLNDLQTMYLELPAMSGNRFTDAHTGTFDIRLGQKVNMDPADCNWNTADCGHSGLMCSPFN